MKSIILLMLAAFSLNAEPQDAPTWLGALQQGTFVQEKQLPQLKRPFVSRGLFAYDPDRKQLIWHTQAPLNNKLLIDEQGVAEEDAQGNPQVLTSDGQVSQVLLILFSGDVQSWQEVFDLTWQQECVTMTPKQPFLRDLFSQFELCRLSDTQQQIRLFETNGTQARIVLAPMPESEPEPLQ
ncbi:LolA family protein [Bowmanella pacifica]|uniref:Outer membrane lipoprotein carrier protein LolA n=2 Tax=Bowmanella TaxID=366580 RepID=A0A917YT05_9ALTE|nr:outer-membrane lipoprotein carrier protein LolA [Bowmanella pacifica]GGO65909.1 hypothetical protein GCM10010982_08840 [Bowmanella pacifica]